MVSGVGMVNPSSVTVPNGPDPRASIPNKTFTAFDRWGVAVGALGLALSAVDLLVMRPVFAKMFADFRVPLPRVTELFLTPWFLSVFLFVTGLSPFVVVVAGVLRSTRLRTRAKLMACAILLVGVQQAAFFFGTYLPIFSIAYVR
jgi:hypothetical protein